MSGWRSTALAIIVFAASGCGSRGTGGGFSDRSVITGAEIRASMQDGVRDVYELIQRTRPRWLQVRAERSLNLETVILVYQNSQVLGGVGALRGLQLANVRAIRYYDSAQAGQLPGGGGQHVEAAIVISTSAR